MRFSGTFTRLLALSLILLLLTVRLSSLTHERFIAPIQNFICKKAFFSDNQQQGINDYKPKRSCLDVASSCAELHHLKTYVPSIAELVPFARSAALPDVYPDIYVPPQNRACSSIVC